MAAPESINVIIDTQILTDASGPRHNVFSMSVPSLDNQLKFCMRLSKIKWIQTEDDTSVTHTSH